MVMNAKFMMIIKRHSKIMIKGDKMFYYQVYSVCYVYDSFLLNIYI